jgi:hypothetical protein
MVNDLVLKGVIIAVSVGTVYSMLVYHIRFQWKHSRAGRIMMVIGSCLAISGALSVIGSFFPNAPWRPYTRTVGWSFILVMVVIWAVSVTIIKKPKGTRPEI